MLQSKGIKRLSGAGLMFLAGVLIQAGVITDADKARLLQFGGEIVWAIGVAHAAYTWLKSKGVSPWARGR